MKSIEDLLKESIVEVCGVDASKLESGSLLVDIGVDSLASAEVLVDLEIRLGKQFPVGTLRRLEHATTISDLAGLLEETFPTRSPAGSP